MPIVNVTGKTWAGAAAGVIKPITSADCTVYPTFEELVRAEAVVSRGCTVRAGRGWAKRTVAQIASTCYAVPTITGYNSPGRNVAGVRFFEKVGVAKLEVDVGAGWVERSTTTWSDVFIHHSGSGLLPTNKLRVTNKYGLVSNVWTV